jgi:hypothetical protein
VLKVPSALPGIELRLPNPEAVKLLSCYESLSGDSEDKQDNFMQVR